MKKIISIIAIAVITPLVSQAQNADFSFGSAVGFGGALFDNKHNHPRFFDSGVFTTWSGDIATENDPFAMLVTLTIHSVLTQL